MLFKIKLKDSSLESIVKLNSMITKVGNCDVKDTFTYYECLFKMDKAVKQPGYCMSVNEILNMASPLGLFIFYFQ
jgi:hypothetical protein